jgi:hypothetical protein
MAGERSYAVREAGSPCRHTEMLHHVRPELASRGPGCAAR